MTSKLLESIVAECHRIEEDSLYSSKSHYNVSDRWDKYNLWLGVPLGILTALSGLAAVKSTTSVVVMISLTATVLTSLNTSLNPSKRAALHKASATEYNKLKNDIRIFREIELIDTGLTQKQLKDKITYFSNRRGQLNSSSPNIPRWAFKKTQNDIQKGDATYHVDKE